MVHRNPYLIQTHPPRPMPEKQYENGAQDIAKKEKFLEDVVDLGVIED